MAQRERIHILKDKHMLAEFACKLWKMSALKAVKEKGSFTAALSGGNTPCELYKTLAGDKTFPWPDTSIFIVDERFVPFTHDDSNYRMIKETLLDPAGLSPDRVYCVPAEENTPRDAAEKYNIMLKTFFNAAGGIPGFDLVTLGLGEDGHTASLFPGDNASMETHELTAAVKIDRLKNERITITLPVINNSKQVIFMVSGEKKAEVAKKVMIDKDRSFPASRVRPEKGELIFLLDKEAGKYIPQGSSAGPER